MSACKECNGKGKIGSLWHFRMRDMPEELDCRVICARCGGTGEEPKTRALPRDQK